MTAAYVTVGALGRLTADSVCTIGEDPTTVPVPDDDRMDWDRIFDAVAAHGYRVVPDAPVGFEQFRIEIQVER